MMAKKRSIIYFFLPVFPLLVVAVFLRSLRKASLDCEQKVRLGDSYGGWVTCKPIKSLRGTIVYTVGIGRNIEWDKEMIKTYGTMHHGWDPTPTAEDFFRKQPPPKGFTFHKFGLGTTDGNVTLKLPVGNFDSYAVMEHHARAQPGTVISAPMITARSMMKMLGHKKLSIFKVDIEGAEFDVIDQWSKLGYSIPADQVLIEFHERYFPGRTSIVETAVAQMQQLGFHMVHRTKLEYTFAKHTTKASKK